MHQQENPSGILLRKTLCYVMLLVSLTLYAFAWMHQVSS
jgi:hypothetical protein